jgi:SlyX protein
MDERIIALEERIAFQERVIEDLDEIVRAFTRRVEALERDLAELRKTVVATPDAIGPADEKPPHY